MGVCVSVCVRACRAGRIQITFDSCICYSPLIPQCRVEVEYLTPLWCLFLYVITYANTEELLNTGTSC